MLRMSLIVEPCGNEQSEPAEKPTCEQYIFENKNDMEQSVRKLCYGDLYVLGKLWIAALKTVLVGTKMSLIPVVEAAPETKTPTKPPPMKLKDLSIYQSPHSEYKEYEEDKLRCPERNIKLIHQTVYPYVKDIRKEAMKAYKDIGDTVAATCNDICGTYCTKKKEFKQYMRDPDNLLLGRAVVATSAVSGFIIGRKMSKFGDSILRGLFMGGLGALAAGALCFPKETDRNFRQFCHQSGAVAFALINKFYGTNYGHRERMLCESELPPAPPKRPEICPTGQPKKK